MRIERRAVNRAIFAYIPWPKEGLHGRIKLIEWGRNPIVVFTDRFFPIEPELAGIVGKQVLFRKSVHFGEPKCAFTGQKAVICAFHDKPGHGSRVHDIS
jgi:hypothetical protein